MPTVSIRFPTYSLLGSYYLHTFNNYQFYDDAFWTHGAHTIKFGGGAERMQYNYEAFQNQGGLWKFNNMASYLQNAPNHFEAGIPASITPRELRQSLFAGYVQDDWRVRPNLTLNLGVRYEMTTVINDAQNKIASLLNISDPAPQCGKQYTSPILSNLPGVHCASVGPYYSNPPLRTSSRGSDLPGIHLEMARPRSAAALEYTTYCRCRVISSCRKTRLGPSLCSPQSTRRDASQARQDVPMPWRVNSRRTACRFLRLQEVANWPLPRLNHTLTETTWSSGT